MRNPTYRNKRWHVLDSDSPCVQGRGAAERSWPESIWGVRKNLILIVTAPIRRILRLFHNGMPGSAIGVMWLAGTRLVRVSGLRGLGGLGGLGVNDHDLPRLPHVFCVSIRSIGTRGAGTCPSFSYFILQSLF